MVLAATVAMGGLGGCGAVVGAGAATGVAAFQERGVEGAAQDLKLEAGIIDRWLNHGAKLATKISVEVYEGRALLTGVVTPSEAGLRADAVKLAWKVQGVKDVINEIQVGKTGLLDLSRDSWITAQLKSRLTFDKSVLAINYAIETVNGTVYLIGIAQSKKEEQRAIAHARSIKYVRKVISHARIKNKG